MGALDQLKEELSKQEEFHLTVVLEGDPWPLIRNTAELTPALEKGARLWSVSPDPMAKFCFYNTIFKPGQLSQKSTDKT